MYLHFFGWHVRSWQCGRCALCISRRKGQVFRGWRALVLRAKGNWVQRVVCVRAWSVYSCVSHKMRKRMCDVCIKEWWLAAHRLRTGSRVYADRRMRLLGLCIRALRYVPRYLIRIDEFGVYVIHTYVRRLLRYWVARARMRHYVHAHKKKLLGANMSAWKCCASACVKNRMCILELYYDAWCTARKGRANKREMQETKRRYVNMKRAWKGWGTVWLRLRDFRRKRTHLLLTEALKGMMTWCVLRALANEAGRRGRVNALRLIFEELAAHREDRRAGRAQEWHLRGVLRTVSAAWGHLVLVAKVQCHKIVLFALCCAWRITSPGILAVSDQYTVSGASSLLLILLNSFLATVAFRGCTRMRLHMATFRNKVVHHINVGEHVREYFANVQGEGPSTCLHF